MTTITTPAPASEAPPTMLPYVDPSRVLALVPAPAPCASCGCDPRRRPNDGLASLWLDARAGAVEILLDAGPAAAVARQLERAPRSAESAESADAPTRLLDPQALVRSLLLSPRAHQVLSCAISQGSNRATIANVARLGPAAIRGARGCGPTTLREFALIVTGAGLADAAWRRAYEEGRA